jgi:hypothetical protein
MKYPNYLFILPITFISILSCSKEGGSQGPEGPQGENGKKSLMTITTVGPNSTCANGGTLIQTGIDNNNNNKLDQEEIDDSAYVCNGADGNYDKQIIIKLAEIPISLTPSSELVIPIIPGFNKENFTGVDSIVLYAQPYSNDQPRGFAKVELYNVTDKKVIENSAVESSILYPHNSFLSSKNCYTSIPDKAIDLGIRLTGSYSANTGRVILMLYRK